LLRNISAGQWRSFPTFLVGPYQGSNCASFLRLFSSKKLQKTQIYALHFTANKTLSFWKNQLVAFITMRIAFCLHLITVLAINSPKSIQQFQCIADKRIFLNTN